MFGALHILVNNAGFTWDGVIHKMTPKQWETMLTIHCTAPFRLIQVMMLEALSLSPNSYQGTLDQHITARLIVCAHNTQTARVANAGR